jgi:hypothetical protein
MCLFLCKYNPKISFSKKIIKNGNFFLRCWNLKEVEYKSYRVPSTSKKDIA